MNTQALYNGIINVRRITNIHDANELLEAGWILLNTESYTIADHDWGTAFVLGWDKSKGEIVEPLTTAQKWSNFKKSSAE